MVDHRNPWTCALLLVDEYGTEASVRAAETANQLAAAGDDAGKLRWLRILDTIDWLQDRHGHDRPGIQH